MKIPRKHPAIEISDCDSVFYDGQLVDAQGVGSGTITLVVRIVDRPWLKAIAGAVIRASRKMATK